MAPRHLINEDGKPFEDRELDALGKELDALALADRRDFRDANARAVARHLAIRMLIVAGPGTGKSTLFKERILFWLEQDGSAKILSLSFVRKLVADLAADVQNDTTLTNEQKRQADISTLHKYARSVVEQNHGTIAAEFVRLKVDVIVTNMFALPTLMQATEVIPIVFPTGTDPVGGGLVASLARPGGNVTGLSMQSTDLASKRLELLREVLPRLRRLATIGNAGNPQAVHRRQRSVVCSSSSVVGARQRCKPLPARSSR